MKNINRLRGQQSLNGIRRFDPQNARICKLAFYDLAPGFANSMNTTFKSEKIPIRIGSSNCNQKRPISTAKVYLNGHAAPVNCLEIERREIILRHDLRLG